MHIDPASLETVLGILREQVPEYEVRAFGSRVHGRALKRFSDLDLVVITDSPLDPLRLADLKEAFSESDLPFKVDVLDWSVTNERFRRVIEKEWVVVRAAEGTSG
jgi:predicted nucleotidyltransferase